MKVFIVFTFIAIFSCVAVQSDIDSYQVNNDDWELTTKKSTFQKAKEVVISIRNISSGTLEVLDPFTKRIEGKTAEGWIPIIYPYCPCNNKCPNPPDFIGIEKGDEFMLTWNKTTIKCEGGAVMSAVSQSGLYRFNLKYREERKVKIVNYYFSI